MREVSGQYVVDTPSPAHQFFPVQIGKNDLPVGLLLTLVCYFVLCPSSLATLKGLSHEIDFKNVYKNLQN
jgi:hypothetical protein